MIFGSNSNKPVENQLKPGINTLNHLLEKALTTMSKRKITKEGQPCWHCETPVIKRTPRKKSRGSRAYYFEYYFKCPNPKCPAKFVYMPEEAKRFWSEKSELEGVSPALLQKTHGKLALPKNDFPQTTDSKDGVNPSQSLPL